MLSRRSLFQLDVASRDGVNPDIATVPVASDALDGQHGAMPNADAEPLENIVYTKDFNAVPVTAPALTLALAACGGGGGGGSSGSTPPPPVATVLKPANEAEAVKFLARAQLAASPAEITRLTSAGYVSWLDSEIAKPIGETAVAAYIRLGGEDIANQDYFSLNFHTQVMWQQFLDSSDQLRKRVAFALSEFFVVSGNGVDAVWAGQGLNNYWDMLNRNAFGNFRTLLEDVTLNPIMGQYLSLNGSKKEDARSGRRPDENYAREVMQLFTIGLVQLNPDGSVRKDASGNPLPTYTNDDVTNIARALSGWAWQGTAAERLTQDPWLMPGYMKRPMTADPALMQYTYTNKPSDHSLLEATFLGVTIPANTEAVPALKTVLDTLFNHANTPVFFAKQMIQRLVTSNPSPAYIDRVGKVFVNNGQGVRGDLGAVFKAILMDSEALGTGGPTFGKVREPFLRLVQWARTFNLKKPASGRYDLFDTSQQSNSLGQMVLRAPSVFNFFRPGYVPAGTAIASNNLVAPEFQIVNEISTIGYANYMHNVVTNRANPNLEPDYTAEAALANDSTALINRIDLLLTGTQLSQSNKDRIRQAVDSITLPATNDTDARMNRVAAAIVLTMVSPQYLIQK
ncbi:MAG TPA: DUF1800 domain-containing protein [Sphingorhabdus sp.]|nr:DUF1800 domain-containing protein [Sphingorhabdus sp.]